LGKDLDHWALGRHGHWVSMGTQSLGARSLGTRSLGSWTLSRTTLSQAQFLINCYISELINIFWLNVRVLCGEPILYVLYMSRVQAEQI
jgi:hypothetical protein